MTSDRRPTISDRRRVRKLIIRDQPVDARDLNTAKRFVHDASRFRPLWIGLTVLATGLLLADVLVGATSGRWNWITTSTPPLLILTGVMAIRDNRRGQRWAAHHLDTTRTD